MNTHAYAPTTFEDIQISSHFSHEVQLSALQADRRDAGIMARAQRSGASYIMSNRDGYSVLTRVRLLDLG